MWFVLILSFFWYFMWIMIIFNIEADLSSSHDRDNFWNYKFSPGCWELFSKIIFNHEICSIYFLFEVSMDRWVVGWLILLFYFDGLLKLIFTECIWEVKGVKRKNNKKNFKFNNFLYSQSFPSKCSQISNIFTFHLFLRF